MIKRDKIMKIVDESNM
jgi:CRP-like cAMP-binding protein